MIKILVLDDEKGTCEQLLEFLGYRGYRVFGALKGEEALAILERERPEIMLLDVKMPGIDGLDVLSQAKEKYPDIKVVMITAVRSPEARRQALAMGADEYIVKPFSYESLESCIIKLVNEILQQGGLE